MRRGMVKKLRTVFTMAIGVLIFKLLLARSSIEYGEETSNDADQFVAEAPKSAEEKSSPRPGKSAERVRPQSVEIIPDSVNAFTARLNSFTRDCCKRSPHISGECYGYCTFDKLDSETIVELAVQSSSCKLNINGVWSMMQCMSSGHDHTECCRAKGVHKSEVGDVCLDYCSGKLKPEPLADMRYHTCLSVWEPITACFKEHIVEKYLTKRR